MTTHDRDKIDAAITATTNNWTEDTTFIERLYAIAHEDGHVAEREDCAKIVDQYDYARFGTECAEAIRARDPK